MRPLVESVQRELVARSDRTNECHQPTTIAQNADGATERVATHRIDNDIVPAKLLGMRTVLIRTGRHINQQPRSWDEIPDQQATNAAGILTAIERLLDIP